MKCKKNHWVLCTCTLQRVYWMCPTFLFSIQFFLIPSVCLSLCLICVAFNVCCCRSSASQHNWSVKWRLIIFFLLLSRSLLDIWIKKTSEKENQNEMQLFNTSIIKAKESSWPFLRKENWWHSFTSAFLLVKNFLEVRRLIDKIC